MPATQPLPQESKEPPFKPMPEKPEERRAEISDITRRQVIAALQKPEMRFSDEDMKKAEEIFRSQTSWFELSQEDQKLMARVQEYKRLLGMLSEEDQKMLSAIEKRFAYVIMAAEAAPMPVEVAKLDEEQEKLTKEAVTAWLDKYGKDGLKNSLGNMVGAKPAVNEDLLTRLAYELRSHPENLTMPGGLHELNEAIREIAKNSGIDLSKVNIDEITTHLINSFINDIPPMESKKAA